MLNCTVTLGTEKGQQVQMAISVIVEDVNDNSPAFEDNSITKVVSEVSRLFWYVLPSFISVSNV